MWDLWTENFYVWSLLLQVKNKSSQRYYKTSFAIWTNFSKSQFNKKWKWNFLSLYTQLCRSWYFIFRSIWDKSKLNFFCSTVLMLLHYCMVEDFCHVRPNSPEDYFLVYKTNHRWGWIGFFYEFAQLHSYIAILDNCCTRLAFLIHVQNCDGNKMFW